jgi:hypothetical protein
MYLCKCGRTLKIGRTNITASVYFQSAAVLPIPHLHKYLSVSSNSMRPTITFIFSLFLVVSYRQKYNDTTISIRTLDSLISETNNLKKALKKQEYRYRLQTETFKVDTINTGQDSTFINLRTKDGTLLKRIRQLKKGDCVIWEMEEFFNKTGLLEYAESENLSCGTPKNNDPDIKIFNGMVTEMERFEYDSLGRVILRVWWYYSIGTRRYSYSYDDKNHKITKMTYIQNNEFWL